MQSGSKSKTKAAPLSAPATPFWYIGTLKIKTSRTCVLTRFHSAPSLCQAPQDERVSLCQLHIVMIGVLSANRNHMGGNVRSGIPARYQWVHNNPGALACGELEKIVAEVLNNGVRIRSVR